MDANLLAIRTGCDTLAVEGMDMQPLSSGTLSSLTAPSILNSLPDGAYIVDPDRRILFWNDAAIRITGWPRGEIMGRTCSDNILVHIDKDGHELCGKEYCPLHRCIVTGEPSREPLLVYAKHRSGVRIAVEVSVAPVRDLSGAVVGGIELFRDLTESMRDLERAHRIQAAAMTMDPEPDPRLAIRVRYTPSDVVGGDFYHYEILGPDLLGVMVADVMGHGIASALYSMQLRSLWEDWRGEASSPARFLTHINRQLHALAGDAGYFATAVCATVNPARGTVELVSAGHPPPLHLRGQGGIRAVGNAQPALGMILDTTYEPETLSMERGETLLFYTDGAIEIERPDGSELGEAGLIGLLSQPGICEDGAPRLEVLEDMLLSCYSGVRLADDLTLLSITRR